VARFDSQMTAHPIYKKLVTASGGYSSKFTRIVKQAKQDAVQSGR
jgi:hypothetical protein